MIFRSPYPRIAIPEVPFSNFVFANLAHWADRPAFIDGSSGHVLTHGQVHSTARHRRIALFAGSP